MSARNLISYRVGRVANVARRIRSVPQVGLAGTKIAR